MVSNFEEFPTLKSGEILVCPATSTAWTPLFLKIAGVHAMQGYLFGKPMPIAALREMLSPEAVRARSFG